MSARNLPSPSIPAPPRCICRSEAIGLQAGDFVLTTPYTFAATAEVIRYFDAVPVFVDVEPDTLNIDPSCLVRTIEDLERCLREGCKATTSRRSPGTRREPDAADRGRRARQPRRRRGALKAVIPVHIAGHPCEMDAITAIAEEHGLAVVEDAAHACSASFKGRPVGSEMAAGVPWAAVLFFLCHKDPRHRRRGHGHHRQRGVGGPHPHDEPARDQQGCLEALHGGRQLVLRDHGAWLQVQHAGYPRRPSASRS